jgi:hypothetical protein
MSLNWGISSTYVNRLNVSEIVKKGIGATKIFPSQTQVAIMPKYTNAQSSMHAMQIHTQELVIELLTEQQWRQ